MVREDEYNCIGITALLQNDFPRIADEIINSCSHQAVELVILKDARDYWCRDFMPVQVSPGSYVQFTYAPSYYQPKKFQHLQTDPAKIKKPFRGHQINTDILLEPGNLVTNGKLAISTSKIFRDNAGYSAKSLVKKLCGLLNLEELLIIPTLPHDITGHADGMVQFVNEHTLLINDFTKIAGKRFNIEFLQALKRFELVMLNNDLHLNRHYDDATGDYINFVIIKNELLLPCYQNTSDEKVYRIIETVFPGKLIVPADTSRLGKEGGLIHCASWGCAITDEGLHKTQ